MSNEPVAEPRTDKPGFLVSRKPSMISGGWMIAASGGALVLIGMLALPWLRVSERNRFGNVNFVEFRFHDISKLVTEWEYSAMALAFFKGAWIFAYVAAIGIPAVLARQSAEASRAMIRRAARALVLIVAFLLWEAVGRLEVLFVAFISAREISEGVSFVRHQFIAGYWVTLLGLGLLFVSAAMSSSSFAPARSSQFDGPTHPPLNWPAPGGG